MKRLLLVLFAAALAPLAASAQQPAAPETNPVSNALRAIVTRQSRVLVAAANEMPADKYSYHPTADQMTFGRLIAHIATSNFGLCSTISGMPAPKQDPLSETDPKDKLAAAIKASFDFCTQSLANLDDSKLGEQLPFFGGRAATRATLMFVLAADFSDHYSTAASYLRLNGLLPPTAQPRK
ncbi:MAG TPA: DinB family protein [Candidatus Aquilonibacter sp.]|nr:DinB family protein [Candidatus Aquilonibacter sp.]